VSDSDQPNSLLSCLQFAASKRTCYCSWIFWCFEARDSLC
jgi:hypothetical protein